MQYIREDLEPEDLKIFKILIQELRNQFGQSFQSTDHDKQLMKGHRWNDDDRIIRIAYNNKPKEEGYADLVSLSSKELEARLIDALRNAASADYYYKYEKEWD